MSIKVAYCTGFWCTNIGNAFFSMGVEYVLKKLLGEDNVTLVSDLQTYTTSYGKRLYPHKNQLEYISQLDVDYVVLAGPVISKYFLMLWEDILVALEKRGVRYILLSAGMMKMNEDSFASCTKFFSEHPPFIFTSREKNTFDTFGKYADNAYDGICFSFFAPDYYSPVGMGEKYFALNFDKIAEPRITTDSKAGKDSATFNFDGKIYHVRHTSLLTRMAYKTDRFSDALIYAASLLPQKRRSDKIGDYRVIRTDHRFHPHFRSKIYSQGNSFCADLPYAYFNIYANSSLTMSDRVHACAVTLAYGGTAMLFSQTERVGLLERVGAGDITKRPVKLDLDFVNAEKKTMVEWLESVLK